MSLAAPSATMSRMPAGRERIANVARVANAGAPDTTAAAPCPLDTSSPLSALLGGPRATILRSLDRPTSIGRLADLLFAVPSAATHHAAALEAAGLVARERRGRHVLVRRTPRGSALLALYDAPASAALAVGPSTAALAA